MVECLGEITVEHFAPNSRVRRVASRASRNTHLKQNPAVTPGSESGWWDLNSQQPAPKGGCDSESSTNEARLLGRGSEAEDSKPDEIGDRLRFDGHSSGAIDDAIDNAREQLTVALKRVGDALQFELC